MTLRFGSRKRKMGLLLVGLGGALTPRGRGNEGMIFDA
jgi:hypothetical protein